MGILVEEEREIPQRPTFAERVRAVLVELIKAKGTETRSPLPPGVELRQVFLDDFGSTELLSDPSREVRLLELPAPVSPGILGRLGARLE